MIGNDVFKSACALLFEGAGEDKYFKNAAVNLINLLIAEVLPTQNCRRRARGEEETALFELQNIEDVITLDLEFKLPLSYGLASYFYQDEKDNFLAQEYRARFVVALDELKKIETLDIADEYPNESEE